MRATIKGKIVEASPSLAVVKGKVAEVKQLLAVVKGKVVEVWANGLKTMYKGIAYLPTNRRMSFRTREGKVLGTVANIFTAYAYHYDISDDGAYAFRYDNGTTYFYKYNEATQAYATYGSSYQHRSDAINNGKYVYVQDQFMTYRMASDGMHCFIADDSFKNASGARVILLTILKNTGSGFAFLNRVELCALSDFDMDWRLLTGYTSISNDGEYVAFGYANYISARKVTYVSAVAKRADDNYNYTRIYTKTRTDTSEWFYGPECATNFISRTGKYALLNGITRDADRSIANTHLLSYINGNTVTNIFSVDTLHLHVMHSRNGRNLYVRSARGIISCYSCNGASVTLLGTINTGSLWSDSVNCKEFGGYIDEVDNGLLAIMVTSNGLCLCEISKDANGLITAYSEVEVLCNYSDISYYMGAMLRSKFIGTKY